MIAIPVRSCNPVAIAGRDRPRASPSSIYPGGLVELSRWDCCGIVDCMGLRRYCNPLGLEFFFAVVREGSGVRPVVSGRSPRENRIRLECRLQRSSWIVVRLWGMRDDRKVT